MKTQELINVLYCHKSSIVIKLYFSNQDVKEIREMTIYKDSLEAYAKID